MRWSCCLVVLICLAAPAAEVPQRRPVLGITVDQAEIPFDGQQGVRVLTVAPGSNGARLGLRPDDRILALGGKSIAGVEDIAQALDTVRADSDLTISVRRGDQTVACTGRLEAPVTPKAVADRAKALEERVDALAQQAGPRRYSLPELLVILRQIEQDLPAAAREFKATYPDGRFHIAITIDIDSDTTRSGGDAKASPEVAAPPAAPVPPASPSP